MVGRSRWVSGLHSISIWDWTELILEPALLVPQLILSESEKSAAQQPSSSGTSLAVRYLYYAGCNTGLMTPDQLERLLICSAKHNGEHTAELIAALRDAGCKTIAHLSLDQAYGMHTRREREREGRKEGRKEERKEGGEMGVHQANRHTPAVSHAVLRVHRGR